jgi:eukaryotic-like serine/threonine-protein kinase
MELLDGECLADVIEREGRLDAVTALRVMLPIAGALEAMHGKGILHRDVKPDNVFLSRDDAGRWQPKLIDFGLARIDSRARAGRITQRGMVIGTPVYLSPERIRGEEAGAKDDVWALCVSLYVTVTGELPFEGDNVMDVFVALAKGAPRSLEAHGIDDPALWEILRRGLGPPGTRWPSMAELERALTEELLRRGATRDIAGGALRSTAFAFTPPPPAPTAPAAAPAPRPSGPSPNRPGWQVYTARMARPDLPGVTSPRALSANQLPTLSDPFPAEPRPSPPPAGPLPGARLTPAIALGLVMLGVVIGLVVGIVIGAR